MNRIIPQVNQSKKVLPPWMDPKELVSVSKKELDDRGKGMAIKKIASNDIITYSFACGNCKKTFYKDSNELQSQENLQKRAGVKEIKYNCPICSSDLTPYNSTLKLSAVSNAYANQTEVRKDLVKEASTYNTYVDRHLVFKSLNALQDFASKQGMWGARARYLTGDHIKEAGQEFPLLNNFNCELEWKYGRQQTARVTASIGIDQAGRFKMPRVFKTIDGKEWPFEKESVLKVEKEIPLYQPELPRKKTDLPTYKKPDISNFNVTSGLKTHADGAMNPGGAGMSYQPGQQVYNLGKPYTVKTVTPGQGVTVTDPITGQDMVISEQNTTGLSIYPGTTSSFRKKSNSPLNIQAMIDEEIEKILPGGTNDPGIGTPEWVHGVLENATNRDLDDTRRTIYDWEGPTGREKHGNILDLLLNAARLDGDNDSNSSDAARWYDAFIQSSLSPFGSSPHKTSGRFSGKRGTPNPNMKDVATNWLTLRNSFKLKSNLQESSLGKEVGKESRQIQALKDVGYSPEMPGKDKTGHDKLHNLPFSEEREIGVGLTDFPFGEKRDSSNGLPTDKDKQQGYRIPFNEMNDNQVKDRERFPTQDLLHLPSTPVRDLNIYDNFSIEKMEKEAVLDILGIAKIAGEGGEEIPERDVIFQHYKKSPPKKEFKEPEVINEATGGVKEMITKFKQTQVNIELLQNQIKEKEKPLLEALQNSSKELRGELSYQQDILKSYLGRLWKRLDDVKDKIVFYEQSILGNIETNKIVTKPASLPEILDRAAKMEPQVVEVIERIKALIENERTQEVIEKLLVEYPISEVQKPKLKSSSSEVNVFMSWLVEAGEVMDGIDELISNM